MHLVVSPAGSTNALACAPAASSCAFIASRYSGATFSSVTIIARRPRHMASSVAAFLSSP